MSEDRELTPEELERQEGEPLPDREAMSITTPYPTDGGFVDLGLPTDGPTEPPFDTYDT